MCFTPALPSSSLWLEGWLQSFVATSQARPMAVAVLIVKVQGADDVAAYCLKQRTKSLITELFFSLSGCWFWYPMESHLTPAEYGDGLGRSPQSSPSLLSLWVLLSMDGGGCWGRGKAWAQKGSLICATHKLLLSPHTIQGLLLLDQVNTTKPKVAQLTILRGTTKEMGNLFKNQIFLSCKRDWHWC